MAVTVDPARVEALREVRGRRRPELRVRSEKEALEFVNSVGFCFLFTSHGFAMPTLWEAICGEARALEGNHDDSGMGTAWDWKDTLPAR